MAYIPSGSTLTTEEGINQVNANQAKAAAMGVTIPGANPYMINGQPTTKYLYDQYNQTQNQGKAGYDIFGVPIPGYTAPPSTNTKPTPSGTSSGYETTDTSQEATNNDPNVIAAQDALKDAQKLNQTTEDIKNGVIPLSPGEQAQIDGLQHQFDLLIQQQETINKGGLGEAQVRGYQTGAGEYDPTFQIKTIANIASAGVAKINDLRIEQAAAVAKLTQSLKDADIKSVKDAYDTLKTAKEGVTKAIAKHVEDVQKAIKEANDAKIAADKVVYDEITKPIQDLKQIVKDNGAPSNIMAAVGKATTLDEAYAAAGDYAAQGTGAVAEYNYAKANGYTGTISQYQLQQETMKANAKAQADALANGYPIAPEMPAGMGGTANGGSILSATGLSIAAFNYLTQGTASMSRMPVGMRTAIMREAENWSKKNGVDVATFQSQYKAYNEVLQKNLQRSNQTTIMAGEVSGTADSLIEAIQTNGGEAPKSYFGGQIPEAYTHGTSNMSTMRPAIILDLMAGKQVNNQFAQTYSTQIQLLANDLAGYLAASRGTLGTEGPTENDRREAANIISAGMSAGTVDAFKKSINNNEEKVTVVVNKAADSARRQVWTLFGVGDKYAGVNSAADMAAEQSYYNGITLPVATDTGGVSGSTYNGVTLPN